MTTSTELLTTVSDTLGLGESHVANTFRALKSAGLISSGGRGRNAASMQPSDAAVLIASLCGIDRQQDAPDLINSLQKCKDGNGNRFLADLTRLFETGSRVPIEVAISIPYVSGRIGSQLYKSSKTLQFESDTNERDRRTITAAKDFSVVRSFTNRTIEAVSALFL